MMAADETPKGRILTAAVQQLKRHGIRKFTVVDVAEAAGMTHPNVYRYFTSKAALIDALVTNWLKPLEERIEMVVGAPDPVPDKLERMVVAISRAYRAARVEEPELFAAFVTATAASRAVSRKHRARMRRAFALVIDEGIGAGVIGMRERARAQALLLDSCWRFIDPASVLAESDDGASLDGRLERVLEAALQRLLRRDFTA
ncbi:MAG: TetR/AcrR family transcriptional regulator [Methylocystis sp.]|nr:TetR/AcrR family transcriptional regulator [Methylocystis sp.]MCA3584845.1 TetR/AcrR family transcriptional regulator [Methylocystis sp.]MCA3587544.1 TetR/AcrR family transcriptional regulator [Methylocystis sp.]MCA3593040.1 TetR/AcrR family transcriptional regulator [Methylocystis sp.]